MRSEIEDGMGFAGLAPTAQERREERQRTQDRLATEICYRGFAYNVRSQSGIDSLRMAIAKNGHG